MADEPKRARLVSTCSLAMGEFTATFAEAQGVTMSELIRLALADYMDYELSPADADAPKPAKQRSTKAKDPEAKSKRQVAINAAMEEARRNNAARAERLAASLANGQPI